MALNKDIIQRLEREAQKKTSQLAHEAQERLIDHYISLIDWFYVDYVEKDLLS